ncbi:mannose-1-phosphate guanylyltransferase [Arcicella sp. DC2W]|uniref:Mannose-1-phosphate guanylyltransferase n=1 Tax=Arcicella gelida TaxID=2984195 RepID=A0ABU5S7W6_9BACT|nr:mannose-1-phosphate guanylyltransferase [Arcicella sp. DC2W]MEA5404573.1 mannose-1-phosphate guanylyltransferase [Arcicella sp. DC2W]
MKNNYVVIMAGGVGTRFWPFSRTNNPKQFHDVLGTGRTLLQQTADRFEGICLPENIYIVTSDIYVDLVKQQLPFLKDEQILMEPCRKNTAPCVAYASFKIASLNPDANIVVAPADHIILKEETFKDKIKICLVESEKNGAIVTLGIRPTRPDTGYGYIQFEQNEKAEVLKVESFREKPNLALANEFIASGNYVWNAGIFIWTAKTIKKAFFDYSTALANIFEKGNEYYYRLEEQGFINEIYPSCESISIDYAILEKANNVYVVLGDIGWSDLGTWKSLYEVSAKDESNTVVDGNVMLYNVKNTIVKTPKERLVVVHGLDGYIIAEFDNVLMICQKEQEQQVKTFVADAAKIDEKYV